LILVGLAGLVQISSGQEHGALGTAKWLLQTLPAETPADADAPEAGLFAQLLPTVGRDDLWVSAPQRSKATDQCEVASPPADSIPGRVAELARSTRVVIINEAHDVPWHRTFTESLLSALWDQGFRYLAAEAFLEHINDFPAEAFGRIDSGFYATESTFGNLIRTAKRLGYHLVPYEATSEDPSRSLSERIALREEEQANHLMERIFSLDPAAKVIIHAGFSHAAEAPLPSSGGSAMSWMAARLKEKTGIDPLTIDQTYCRSAGDDIQLVKPSDRVPLGAFDLAIAYPEISTMAGRATWRSSPGMRVVQPPEAAVPHVGRAILEARPVGEPDAAIPVDRLLLLAGESIPLVLPRGEFRLTVSTEGSREVKELRIVVD
jgi:hypothetical protein